MLKTREIPDAEDAKVTQKTQKKAEKEMQKMEISHGSNPLIFVFFGIPAA